MIYYAIAYNDGTSYGIEAGTVFFDTNHLRFTDADGNPNQIVPYANVKIATEITEEDYVAMLEAIGEEKDE